MLRLADPTSHCGIGLPPGALVASALNGIEHNRGVIGTVSVFRTGDVRGNRRVDRAWVALVSSSPIRRPCHDVRKRPEIQPPGRSALVWNDWVGGPVKRYHRHRRQSVHLHGHPRACGGLTLLANVPVLRMSAPQASAGRAGRQQWRENVEDQRATSEEQAKIGSNPQDEGGRAPHSSPENGNHRDRANAARWREEQRCRSQDSRRAGNAECRELRVRQPGRQSDQRIKHGVTDQGPRQPTPPELGRCEPQPRSKHAEPRQQGAFEDEKPAKQGGGWIDRAKVRPVVCHTGPGPVQGKGSG